METDKPSKPFWRTADKLTAISAELQTCRDPKRRIELLAHMRLYLSEAEALANQPPTV